MACQNNLVVKQIIDLYDQISKLESLKPSKNVDTLFGQLVSTCLPTDTNIDVTNMCEEVKDMRSNVLVLVFVATWNVGGKSPHSGLNLDALLHVHSEFDIYVLGFQEIVPLNAGNVLVLGDNEPAAKWLAMINQSLNKSSSSGGRLGPKTPSFGAGSMFFAKPSLKKISESFRTECRRKLKICNCSTLSEEIVRKYGRESCFRCPEGLVNQSGVLSDDEEDEDDDDDEDEDEDEGGGKVASLVSNKMMMKYGLVASKQMVGIFLTVWMRKELIQHVSHLRISCVTRGIMGCLGNKGCIAVSLQLYKTSFCFICSHLASGEREGDERRRNSDVIEILKNTTFPRICRTPFTHVPDRITKHDRVIWLGDLNYRIALSYAETKTLLDKNAWDTLLNKDQLKIERDAGRVFKGWHEGKIFFAPTYKYSYNSDAYAGDTTKERIRKREELQPGAIGFFGTVMESGSSHTYAASHGSPITGRSAPCLSSTLRFARVKSELGDNNLQQLLKSRLGR